MISLEWVKDYIDINDQNLKELAVKITKAGINVEKVIDNHIDNLVIGEVEECIDHPNSDRLHICKVNIGDKKTIQIICGAPNVKKGLKVIVALPGAVLPGDFEIKKSKIRGEESNGMLCALFELGLEEKTEESYKRGIKELAPDAPIGADPIDYLGLADTLYELDVHKHRNNDCYYHIGFAYEIGAILNRPVTLPKDNYKEINDNIEKHFSLNVDTEKCPFYLAKMVKNIKIGESPDFIKRRLTAAGMRPINNVVDISNYVMLEYGQPLHFFDKSKLGNKILVRDAKDGESIITLDGKERTLKTTDIVITDGNKPICIAGVMGGENTEVDSNTTEILIESAIFDSVRIRYTAANLDLKSEASIRYGKGLNYEYTEKAINRACYLLEKYAGAKVLSGTVKHDKIDKTEKIVEVTPKEAEKILGITISEDDMKVELERLGFDYKLKNGVFTVTIPRRRLDVDPNVNDIVEEIARLYGYHNLVSTLPRVPVKRGQYIGEVKYRKEVSNRLRRLGLNETKTYTLVSPDMANLFDYEKKEKVVLPNPMSIDKSIVRTSIIPSLLNVYDYNKKRKVEDVFIYEISKTYNKKYEEEIKVAGLLAGKYMSNGWSENKKADFYLVKGIVENLLEYMGFSNRYSFEVSKATDLHPGISADIKLDKKRIGIIGRVHPKLNKDEIYVFELSLNALMNGIKPIKFKEAPKYPAIEKDAAYILDKNITAGEVIKTIKNAGGKLLVNIDIFDIYTGINIGHNKKSIAFNYTFRDNTRTLREEEVMDVFDKINNKVCEIHNAKLRDK
ncbi:MAG: phenylalanine--tRNA ligase subunit beta [Clostridia bacterium]|nr:phenylalanine--tRNA ligase subunit beta [Clostridia bacterium]